MHHYASRKRRRAVINKMILNNNSVTNNKDTKVGPAKTMYILCITFKNREANISFTMRVLLAIKRNQDANKNLEKGTMEAKYASSSTSEVAIGPRI